MIVKPEMDAFGKEIYKYFLGSEVIEIVERDDHFIGTSRGPEAYFAPFEKWLEIEKEAIQFAKGRILDLGCGAGRVCLYLQEKGFDVLGIDNSPLAVEVCRQRGVKHVALMSITQTSKKLGVFDTIVMFGNNFGLLENPKRAKWLLRKFYLFTSPNAMIIAQSNDIYKTTEPVHLQYHEYNRQRGRMAGQVRLRVRIDRMIGPWFDYLMVNKEEMIEILTGTGWQITRFIEMEGFPQYFAIIEKSPPPQSLS